MRPETPDQLLHLLAWRVRKVMNINFQQKTSLEIGKDKLLSCVRSLLN